MITPKNFNAKWLTLAFADLGTGAGNFVTDGVVSNVPHGLPYIPGIDQIFAVLTQTNDNAAFANAVLFTIVSIDITQIKIKANRTVANSGVAGQRSIQARILLFEDRENGSRIRL